MHFSRSLLIAGAVLAFSATVAVARPALVVTDVNLRAGPTTASPSYGIIPGGTTVDIRNCGGGWCEAYFGGRRGFIASQYLDGGGPPPVMRVAPPPPPMYGAPPPPPYYYPRRPRYYW